MQVFCTDGTVLHCDRFEAIDSGVLLFGEPGEADASEGETSESEDDEAEPEEQEEAAAFIPLHQLRYVLPDGLQPGAPGIQSVSQPSAQRGTTQTQPTTGAPRQGQTTPQTGQIPSQQSMGGQQSQYTHRTGQQPPQPGSNDPR